MKSYKERLQIAKGFTKSNRLFTVIAIILLIGLTANVVNEDSSKAQPVPTEMTDETVSEVFPTDATSHKPEEEIPNWKFYPIDLWILAVGVGGCTVMIIREKKKARDQL